MRRTTCPLFYQATPPPFSSSKFLSSYHTASLSLLSFVSLCSPGGTRWVDQAGLESKRFTCLCLSSAGSACATPPTTAPSEKEQSWAGKMACQVKVLTTKPDDLPLIPRAHGWKEQVDLRPPHMLGGVCSHRDIHIYTSNERVKIQRKIWRTEVLPQGTISPFYLEGI